MFLSFDASRSSPLPRTKLHLQWLVDSVHRHRAQPRECSCFGRHLSSVQLFHHSSMSHVCVNTLLSCVLKCRSTVMFLQFSFCLFLCCACPCLCLFLYLCPSGCRVVTGVHFHFGILLPSDLVFHTLSTSQPCTSNPLSDVSGFRSSGILHPSSQR